MRQANCDYARYKRPELGPELAFGKINLKCGELLTLTSRDVPGDEHEVQISYPTCPEVSPGDNILWLMAYQPW